MSAHLAKGPTAEEWREAFFNIENHISRVENIAKISEYLADTLMDVIDKRPNALATSGLAGVTVRAAWLLIEANRKAEAAYYEAFNDLTQRDNDARNAQAGAK